LAADFVVADVDYFGGELHAHCGLLVVQEFVVHELRNEVCFADSTVSDYHDLKKECILFPHL
jgi:hypothetical protein